DFLLELVRTRLAAFQMDGDDELFACHGAPGPNVVGGKHAEFFDGKAFERGFDVFRVDVLSFFGDDNIFLTAAEVQVTFGVEPSDIAGAEPAVDDGFGGEFRFMQIAGHDGLAANLNLADAVGTGISNADFHAWKRLSDGVRAKRFQIVDGDRGAGFGEAVAVSDGNADVIEKLQSLRLGERATDNDGAELASKGGVTVLQEGAAEPKTRAAFGEGLVHRDEKFEGLPFAWRKFGEARFQAFLEIFQDQRDEADISDFVASEGFADELRTERAQMDDAGAAGKGAEKANHEINRVIGGKDTEITDARPEGIERSQRNALFEIIFVRHRADLRARTGPGRRDNGSDVLAAAGNEGRFAGFAKLFPAVRAGKIGVGGSFGNENRLNMLCLCAAGRRGKLPPDRIFSDKNFCAGVIEKLPVFGGSELVVERDQHATGIENGVRGNQPLRLIGHDA